MRMAQQDYERVKRASDLLSFRWWCSVNAAVAASIPGHPALPLLVMRIGADTLTVEALPPDILRLRRVRSCLQTDPMALPSDVDPLRVQVRLLRRLSPAALDVLAELGGLREVVLAESRAMRRELHGP